MNQRSAGYESPEDLAQEEIGRKDCEAFWNVGAVKVPKQYRFDFLLFKNNNSWAVVEFKRRGIYYSDYPTIALSSIKYKIIKDFCVGFNLNFFFVVKFKDGLYFCDLSPIAQLTGAPLPLIIVDRNDRDDSEDAEPCIVIPILKFRSME